MSANRAPGRPKQWTMATKKQGTLAPVLFHEYLIDPAFKAAVEELCLKWIPANSGPVEDD